MKPYSLTHVADATLLRALATLDASERATTAQLLAHLAEVDARRLYLPAGYPSLFGYCVGELKRSEDITLKRIRAARTAREFPQIFTALAEGLLELSSVLILASYLTPENAEELLAAASHKTNAGLERLLAERFPKPDLPAKLEALPAMTYASQLAVRPVGEVGDPLAARPVEALAADPRPRLSPLAPGRIALQLTVDQETYELVCYAQALLGHAVPTRELAPAVHRAFKLLVEKLERHKFAATRRPRSGSGHPSRPRNPRHIPAHVKRAVWERDGGRCTFVSNAGRRCPARCGLEFDHALEVARGGESTVANLRLRCRGHNQFEAERAFGAEFMHEKREQARQVAAEARARKAVAAATTSATAAAVASPPEADVEWAPSPVALVPAIPPEAGTGCAPSPTESSREPDPERDVTPWLQALGFSAQRARWAAAQCAGLPESSLEERVRFALRLLAPPHRKFAPNGASM